jgi:hypothetical protein
LLYRVRARPRASLPVFAVALSWLLLTALLPLAFEGERAAEVVEKNPETQQQRLQLFSEALLWPFGLAPANAQAAEEKARKSASIPANCG